MCWHNISRVNPGLFAIASFFGVSENGLVNLKKCTNLYLLKGGLFPQTSEHVPDGRKAPVFEVLSGAPFRTVDTHTQTPSNNQEGQDSSGSGSSSSRSHSASPTYPIMPGASDSRPSSRCSSGGAADAEENVSPELPSGGSKYASSPKPNNSYLFAREPPDGAEKVPLHVEDADRWVTLK